MSSQGVSRIRLTRLDLLTCPSHLPSLMALVPTYFPRFYSPISLPFVYRLCGKCGRKFLLPAFQQYTLHQNGATYPPAALPPFEISNLRFPPLEAVRDIQPIPQQRDAGLW